MNRARYKATCLNLGEMFESNTIQVQKLLPTGSSNLSYPEMSYTHWHSQQPNAEERKERLTSTCIAASGAREAESTVVIIESNGTGKSIHPSLTSSYRMPKYCSWWPVPTVFDKRSGGTRITDSGIFITSAVDEECDLDVSTVINPHIQHCDKYSKKGPCSVTPFVEKNPDNVALTSERKGSVLHSQNAKQATSSSSRRETTAKERQWLASLEADIKRTRQDFHEQAEVLKREIAKLEEYYEKDMKLLEEENNGENLSVMERRWGVPSNYQPTECGEE